MKSGLQIKHIKKNINENEKLDSKTVIVIYDMVFII